MKLQIKKWITRYSTPTQATAEKIQKLNTVIIKQIVLVIAIVIGLISLVVLPVSSGVKFLKL